jgi:glutamate synthase (NADPH/NADH) small chain
VEVGVTVSVDSLKENFDAVVLSGGAKIPADLHPRLRTAGVRFAMEFLTQQNKRVAGDDEIRAAPRGSLTARQARCGDRRR